MVSPMAWLRRRAKQAGELSFTGGLSQPWPRTGAEWEQVARTAGANLLERGWIVAGLVGAIGYVVVAGFAPLDVTNVGWIVGEGDISGAQLGFMFYREAPWSAQIALNPTYGMDFSGSILFSDAVPLLAIPFKALSP